MGMIYMKKALAFFFAAVAVCVLMAATAFADEIDSEKVIAEISPDSPGALQANGPDDETPPLEGSSLSYIDAVGIATIGLLGSADGALSGKASWSYIDSDLNELTGRASKWVYICYHKENYFPYKASDPKPITGLLIVAEPEDPTLDIAWQGKTYHPIPKGYAFFDDATANLKLNYSTGDPARYLYYTNDGWDTGAPILTDLDLTSDYDPSNEARKLDYAYTYNGGDPTSRWVNPANLLSSVSSVVQPKYLRGTYHTHALDISYDEETHWLRCKNCSFNITKKHDLSATNVGACHRISCKGCDYSFDEPHVDKDRNNKCDVCGCHYALSADGKYYGSFPDAWAYAISQDHPVTINLLDTVDANKDAAGKRVDLAVPMSEKIDVTIASPYGEKLIVSQNMPFLIWNGNLKIDANVESACEDSILVFAGLSGKITLGKNGNIAITKATSTGKEVIPGMTNGVILTVGNCCLQTEGGSITFCTDVEGSVGISVPQATEGPTANIGNTTIKGADTAILIEGTASATISSGYYDADDGCALKVKSYASGSTIRKPEVTITGGEFMGATCVDTDSDSVLSIEDGIFKGAFTGKNVTDCMAEGTSAAEIDADGNITQRIDVQRLKDAGDSYTFTERTKIGRINGEDVSGSDSGYVLIAGANTTWKAGGSEGATFASDAPFAKFKQVLVDDSVVDPANYTAWEGSTWVELKPAYLDTLSPGKHKLTIASTDGSVSTDFYIEDSSQQATPESDDSATSTTGDNPATGDSSSIGLLLGLMMLGCLCAVASLRKLQQN